MSRWPLAARAVALVLACLLPLSAHAQEAGFAVTDGARAQAAGSAALVRLNETRYEVDAPDRATTHVRVVITAFGPAGREAAGRIAVQHGGFDRLVDFGGVLRDASGEVVSTLGRRDGEDELMGSIYEDLRVRWAELFSDRYPFTVEWSYTVQHHGVLGWPTWRPQREGFPLEHASFALTVPEGTVVRSRVRDVDALGATARGGTETHTWRLVNQAAITPEPFGPPWWEQAPELRLGTDRFEIGGAPGRLDSWESFGAWYGGLSEGRQRLPKATRAQVREIVAGATTDREKAERLYRYLQTSTRYVSVQLGLGGWQPFSAEHVAEKRYGDCKALTNYMQALLAEVGIASDPVLIEAGAHGSDLDPAFPDHGFNHVVLRVPMRTGELRAGEPASQDPETGEAIWLECTSSHASFGHLGSFTEGRPGLRVTASGGTIVHTPVSTAADNRTAREATVHLDARGSARADVLWRLSGEPRADALAEFSRTTGADYGSLLASLTGLGNLDVLTIDLSDLSAPPEEVSLGAEIEIATAARRAAGRLLVPLALFAPQAPALPASTRPRTQPLRLGYRSLQRDSVRLVPPPGYRIHTSPESVEIESVAGAYRLQAIADDDALLVVRELALRETDLLPEAYDEVRSFFEQVAQADARLAVFKEGD